MKRDLCRAFAELTCHVEDLHGIAVEGQHKDTSPDMHYMLVNQLRAGLAVLDERLTTLAEMISEASR